MENPKPVIGIIISRTCPTCGHHEIGYETETGSFHPLRPGDMIGVFQGAASSGQAAAEPPVSPEKTPPQEEQAFETTPWVPDPLRRHRGLRTKYGVLVHTGLSDEGMSPAMYEKAYRQKLRNLIEKEILIPISVILDQYFAAPHLASGDSRQVADALWEELEEIRTPAKNMETWLKHRDKESLEKLIRPASMEDLSEERATDEQLKRELDEITLEDFLGMV